MLVNVLLWQKVPKEYYSLEGSSNISIVILLSWQFLYSVLKDVSFAVYENNS